MDAVASAIASKLHQSPKEKRTLGGELVKEKEAQQRGITVLQPEMVGGPLREYRASAVVLNLVECSNSGTFKKASGLALETTLSAPAIPGSPKHDILHARSKMLL